MSFRVLFAAVALATSIAAQKPAAADVLKTVGDYLTQYALKISGVAAEEQYTQRDPAMNLTRRLNSDLVWLGFDSGRIAGFRDVYALDAHQLRPRDDRMLKLLANPSESSQQEARALEREGLSRYLSPNLRAFDQPLQGLEFLRAENHAQSAFEVEGVKTQDGVQVVTLRWTTKNPAALLPIPEGLSANGRAWVDAATGAVRQTEVVIGDKSLMAKATTKYVHDKKLDLWVPSELIQQFDISAAPGGLSNMGAGGISGARQSLEARSNYSKFRK